MSETPLVVEEGEEGERRKLGSAAKSSQPAGVKRRAGKPLTESASSSSPLPPPRISRPLEEVNLDESSILYAPVRVGCWGWTKWLWFFVPSFYEICCYLFVKYADPYVNPLRATISPDTIYPRIGKRRATPRWIPYFKAGLAFSFCAVLMITSYFWHYLPAIGTIGDAMFIDDRTRVVYLQEVLSPIEMEDYIGDYARATSFAAQRKLMNNASTADQVDEIGSRWNSATRDGDDIGDAAQTNSWAWLSQMMRPTATGGTGFVAGATQSGLEWLSSPNYDAARHSASSATRTSIPVAPVLEFEERVSGFVAQYQRRAGNIRLKKNNYDMTKLILDLQNSFLTVCKRLEDPVIHAAATARGTQSIKELTVLRDLCREHLAYISTAKRMQDELPTACLCNVDFGLVDSFAYSSVLGQQSQYYINPRVVPLKMEGADATGAAASSAQQQQRAATDPAPHEDNMDAQRTSQGQSFFAYLDDVQPETTAVGRADAAFWRKIGTQFSVKMPRAGIAISTWALPTQANLSQHYGDTFGSSLNSFVNSRAMIIDEEKRRQQLAGMATFDESTVTSISALIDSINARSDDFTGLSLINGLIFDKRLEIDQGKVQMVREMRTRLEEEAATSSGNIWDGIFSSDRAKKVEALALLEAHSSPLALEFHEYLYVPYPHHICVVKCLTKNALLTRFRQIYADFQAGLGDTSAKYLMPRFPFMP